MLSAGYAQVLDNSRGEAFSNKPFFNKIFIANNKIKSIKGQFNYKKSGKAMYPTNYYYVYNFDQKGNLTSTFETKKDNNTIDTVWNEYVYNKKGILVEHKQGTRTGKAIVHYLMDEKDELVGEEYYTESIDENGKKIKLLINAEKFIYENAEKTQKKTVCNNYDLPYKIQVVRYDDHGYMIEQEERFLRTSNFNKKTYQYNDKGWLQTITTYQKGSNLPNEEEHYRYDEYGNLIEKHLYKKQEFITDTQIVYNEKSKLMTAVIIRDVKTDFIMVIRFDKYDYF